MLIDSQKIKELRRNQGLTQQKLADQSGVSQSLIARIEKGKVDPSYSNMKHLLDVLKKGNNSLRAKDIMTKNVKTVKSSDKIRTSARKMKRFGISQLPVLDSGKLVGTIRDKSIAHALVDHPQAKTNKEIMEDVLPTIGRDTPVQAISALLEHMPAVLVMKNSSVKGIITRADLLGLA